MKGYNNKYGHKLLKRNDICIVVDESSRKGWNLSEMPKTIGGEVLVLDVDSEDFSVNCKVEKTGKYWWYYTEDLRLVDKKEEAKRAKKLIKKELLKLFKLQSKSK